ncbi:MAG TPA: hydantoinase/oxoprolinase [Eggerthellaceae bacterium]|nr:hydantoinase/oxoprolinase [Eggerthellaceae bacterium]
MRAASGGGEETIMSLVLGIDTGGTYTDGVVFDRANRKVLAKAKSRTTRDDLSRGITSCINLVEFDDYDAIEIVSLSTTLATNAIVEGAGCEVGLLMIGFELDSRWEVPATEVHVVEGGHSVKGLERKPFDEEAARAALEEMRGKVDAVAISGYLSIRNPEHELRAKELVKEVLEVPVVCAHDLTRSLGIHERTVTAVLNAKLMPIIDNLLKAVRRSLDAKGIKAPIMVVRGDGTLIGESKAKDKPIETLLSGPAASIIGATFLSGVDNGFVLDMGGTTTDVAVTKNGVPRIDEEGANVGNFFTRVKAAAISTFGLGGDSYIQMDMNRKLKIGPQRVHPLCDAVMKHPYLYHELELIDIPFGYLLNYDQVVDCFQINNRDATIVFTDLERRAVAALEDGPHNIFVLAEKLGTLPNLLDLRRLVNAGVLGRISITPTDLLHACGELDLWDSRASKLAVKKLAKRFNEDYDSFVTRAIDAVVDRLCYTSVQSLVNYEGGQFDLLEDTGAKFFFDKQLHPRENDYVHASFNITLPLIAIGAPVKSWVPRAAARIGCKLFIPENAEVANAVGSAVARVIENVRILITPGENNDGFNLHSAYERKFFTTLDEAKEYGKDFAQKQVLQNAKENGARNVELTVNCEDIFAKSGAEENDIYLETRIEGLATEIPDWEHEEHEEHFFVDTRQVGLVSDDSN